MDRISIIGGGVAGLSFANYLHKYGFDFNLYERRKEKICKGHGFIIPSEGLEILFEVVDKDLLFSKGNNLTEYNSFDHTGQLIEERGLNNTFVISRCSLINLLESNLPSNKLHHNKNLERIDFDLEKIDKIYFEDGTEVSPTTVISADGSRSSIREKIFPDNHLHLTQVHEIVNIVEDPELAKEIGNKFIKFHHKDGGLSFGILKISKQKVIWYVQFDITKYPFSDHSTEGIFQFIKTHFGNWCHPIPHIIKNTKFDDAHYWRVYELDELKDYYSGNTIFIGDTAHPLVPFTSQGVASALKDAKLLIELLEKQNGFNEEVFKEYSDTRKDEMRIHINNGKLLRDNFLLELDKQKNNIIPISYDSNGI